MKVEELIRETLKHYEGRPSFKVQRAYSQQIIKHLGHMRPSDLRGATIENYRKARAADRTSPATRNREVGLLRTALRSAIKAETIKVLRVHEWHHEREQPRTRILGESELLALLRWLKYRQPWAFDVLQVLLSTGARSSEVLNATSAEVEVLEGKVRIMVLDPKESDPKVLLATGPAAAAAARLSSRNFQRVFARTNGSGLAGDQRTLRSWLEKWRAEARAPKVVLHDLRRTYACWALRDGHPLEAVGQALGHKSLETTRRYARIDESVREKVGSSVSSRMMLG